MGAKIRENVGILIILLGFYGFLWIEGDKNPVEGEVAVIHNQVVERQQTDIPWESDYPPSLLPNEKININTAAVEDMERLPSVGAVRAAAIMDYRSANGDFTSVAQLMEVYGIGLTILNEIRDYITLG